jgi:hypothetical protein
MGLQFANCLLVWFALIALSFVSGFQSKEKRKRLVDELLITVIQNLGIRLE